MQSSPTNEIVHSKHQRAFITLIVLKSISKLLTIRWTEQFWTVALLSWSPEPLPLEYIVIQYNTNNTLRYNIHSNNTICYIGIHKGVNLIALRWGACRNGAASLSPPLAANHSVCDLWNLTPWFFYPHHSPPFYRHMHEDNTGFSRFVRNLKKKKRSFNELSALSVSCFVRGIEFLRGKSSQICNTSYLWIMNVRIFTDYVI